MNLNSVIIPSSETIPYMVNNKVYVVLIISKTFKFEKRNKKSKFKNDLFGLMKCS